MTTDRIESLALFALEPVLDDPRYDGFSFVRTEPLGDEEMLGSGFCAEDREVQGRGLKIRRVGPLWTPQKVVGRVHRFNDYPCVDLTVPAFSRRAVDVLRPFLESNGELLPLDSDIGEYYAYNITTVADILDPEKSQFEWLDGCDHDDVRNIFDIERYDCYSERISHLSIFRLVEMPSSAYVTHVFVNRVHEHGLRGFHFTKLWPLPMGVSWRDADRAERRRKQTVEIGDRRMPIKGNSLVILIPLVKARPNKDEKRLVSRLLDEIDSLLHKAAEEPDAPYFGSLEGDEYAKGESRLFLSCPDADALVERILPWLRRLALKRPIRVMKRYGEYVDPDCREEWVEL